MWFVQRELGAQGHRSRTDSDKVQSAKSWISTFTGTNHMDDAAFKTFFFTYYTRRNFSVYTSNPKRSRPLISSYDTLGSCHSRPVNPKAGIWVTSNDFRFKKKMQGRVSEVLFMERRSVDRTLPQTEFHHIISPLYHLRSHGEKIFNEGRFRFVGRSRRCKYVRHSNGVAGMAARRQLGFIC